MADTFCAVRDVLWCQVLWLTAVCRMGVIVDDDNTKAHFILNIINSLENVLENQ